MLFGILNGNSFHYAHLFCEQLKRAAKNSGLNAKPDFIAATTSSR